jgi:hypothetical protein
MNGRRAVIGLSLLVALFTCALVAQGASAAEKETTVFTCAPVKEKATFSDEHCDKTKTTGGEGFKHTAIAAKVGESTTVEITNAKTASETTAAAPAILKAANFLGAAAEIKCNKVAGSGTLKNVAGPPMKVEGEGTINFTECTTVKPAKCKVKEPITASVHGESYAPESGTEMGLKLTPASGPTGTFAPITFENNGAEVCPETYKSGSPFPVKGSVIGTANGEPLGLGATSKVTPAMSSLTLGGSAATLEATGTFRMPGGNPLVFTTPPFTE